MKFLHRANIANEIIMRLSHSMRPGYYTFYVQNAVQLNLRSINRTHSVYLLVNRHLYCLAVQTKAKRVTVRLFPQKLFSLCHRLYFPQGRLKFVQTIFRNDFSPKAVLFRMYTLRVFHTLCLSQYVCLSIYLYVCVCVCLYLSSSL